MILFQGVTMWFVKSKRAQTNEDYESWIEGVVTPTLNAMDNNGEAYATVLVIDGTRVNDVRVYEDGIVPTVISRYGTGGGNVPMVFPTLTAANNPSRSPQSTEVTAQVEIMNQATGVVRRLTPVECERLQGFPDNWTDGQADSNRYKQMGNAVAVPVVEWIISRMVAVDE
jgi:site-specific DNA-cytosine methylase